MSKLIIVEGPQGVGKTTITNWLREKLPYTNLYRLSGHRDKAPTGKFKSTKMYCALVDYMESTSGTGVNLLFDRTFISEEVYCRLGYRNYNFSDVCAGLMDRLDKIDYDVIILNLFCGNLGVMQERLNRDKASHLDINFCTEESIRQQSEYYKLMEELSETHKNIRIWSVNTESRSTWERVLENLVNEPECQK
jgi:hypothetical protein